MRRITAAWRIAVDWFESGDLVPLMILVSAVHYSAVLAGRDWWPVAVAIGLLVDLGHYRTVRAAVRYNNSRWQQVAVRWSAVLVMTALSLTYHQRYYNDWWLSAPLPLLIAFLAWQQQTDRRISNAQAAHPVASAPRVIASPELPPVSCDALPDSPAHTCGVCGASFKSSGMYAAHIRWKHKAE